MYKKTLFITFTTLMLFSVLGFVVVQHFSRKMPLQESFNNASGYIQHYFGGTVDQLKHGQIVFSFGCTAKKLLQQSTVKLPYSFDLDSNIITVSQFVNLPSEFEFRDEKLGFKLDTASFGHFKFKGDTQEFIELSLFTTPNAVKIEEGIQSIKELIQKIEAAGWKRTSGFEGSIAQMDHQSIVKMMSADPSNDQVDSKIGPKLMAWQSKDYLVDLHALVLPEKDMDDNNEFKVKIELCIKKI